MKNNFKPKAAIFDLDGLMIDTERPYNKILAEESGKKGYAASSDIFAMCIGMDDRESARILGDHFGSDYPYKEIRQTSLVKFTDFCNKNGIEKRPGLLTLLDFLSDNNIPCAIATSTSIERAHWKLNLTGIKDYFTVMAFGDEVEHGKPAPDVFLLAAKRLNTPLDQCIGFEDSPAGLKALNAAGIKSVFVKDTATPTKDILSTVYRQYESLDLAIDMWK
ncbi:haloacid dehalogenase [Spirochaetia bacterium]|nr:haloacid dehalogenase [Spirochaetia bacterium]